jgi:hypothetical protein
MKYELHLNEPNERAQIKTAVPTETARAMHCCPRLQLPNSETMNHDQADWLGDGFETLIGVFGMLEQEHPKH